MKLKELFLSFLLILFLTSCSGGNSSSGADLQEPDDRSLAKEVLSLGNMNFIKSSFSDFVRISDDEKFILLHYGFFPEGTKIDGNQLVFPCQGQNPSIEGVDIQVNVPQDQNCVNPYNFEFAEEGEAVTVEGLILPLDPEEKSNSKFSNSFSINITNEGIKSSETGDVIESEEGTLLAYYEKL